MKKTQKYYTVPEAAKVLGVSPKSVWNWIENGRLKAEQEYVKGDGWGRKCYRLSHAEVMKEKNAVARCVWCNKVIKGAQKKTSSKYCNPRHMYLYRKDTGYYDRPQ